MYQFLRSTRSELRASFDGLDNGETPTSMRGTDGQALIDPHGVVRRLPQQR